MAESVINQQWRDQHYNTKNPFADTARVPDGLEKVFVDAALFLFKTEGTLWLSKITVNDNTAEVTITDGSNTATGSVGFGEETTKLELRTASGQSAGVLIGYSPGFTALFSMQRGSSTYTRTQTEFAAGCIMPMPNIGVLSLNAGGDPMTKIPAIIGEHGVSLTWTGSAVRVDVNGVPIKRGGVTGLRTITLIGPNEKGAFNFVPMRTVSDSILRISANSNSVTFRLVGVKDASD